jgi:hypothetical protein
MFLPLSCRNTQECADIKERRSIHEERKLPIKLGCVFEAVASPPVPVSADGWK